jgi:hypothetical protein
MRQAPYNAATVRPPCAPKVFAATILRQKRFSATPHYFNYRSSSINAAITLASPRMLEIRAYSFG